MGSHFFKWRKKVSFRHDSQQYFCVIVDFMSAFRVVWIMVFESRKKAFFPVRFLSLKVLELHNNFVLKVCLVG